jgi:hypothetical protein
MYRSIYPSTCHSVLQAPYAMQLDTVFHELGHNLGLQVSCSGSICVQLHEQGARSTKAACSTVLFPICTQCVYRHMYVVLLTSNLLLTSAIGKHTQKHPFCSAHGPGFLMSFVMNHLTPALCACPQHSTTPGNEYGDCTCAMSGCAGLRCYNAPQVHNHYDINMIMISLIHDACVGNRQAREQHAHVVDSQHC